MAQWRTEIRDAIAPEYRPLVLMYHQDYLKLSEKKAIENEPNELYRYDGSYNYFILIFLS